jgi:hypothetical protein
MTYQLYLYGCSEYHKEERALGSADRAIGSHGKVAAMIVCCHLVKLGRDGEMAE